MHARVVLAVLVCLPATAAPAGEMPVRPGIVYCGDGLDLHIDGYGGEDYYCEALGPAASDGAVIVRCNWAEADFGEPWTEAVIVEEHPDRDLAYFWSEDNGEVILNRCDDE